MEYLNEETALKLKLKLEIGMKLCRVTILDVFKFYLSKNGTFPIFISIHSHLIQSSAKRTYQFFNHTIYLFIIQSFNSINHS
mmetsp:Transcript_9958/g.14529  ORF Transcript_9958/g.14529 Transcript_9958/m.14529 type:complete len:82 (+) Transcript_9958:45-290(+)